MCVNAFQIDQLLETPDRTKDNERMRAKLKAHLAQAGEGESESVPSRTADSLLESPDTVYFPKGFRPSSIYYLEKEGRPFAPFEGIMCVAVAPLTDNEGMSHGDLQEFVIAGANHDGNANPHDVARARKVVRCEDWTKVKGYLRDYDLSGRYWVGKRKVMSFWYKKAFNRSIVDKVCSLAGINPNDYLYEYGEKFYTYENVGKLGNALTDTEVKQRLVAVKNLVARKDTRKVKQAPTQQHLFPWHPVFAAEKPKSTPAPVTAPPAPKTRPKILGNAFWLSPQGEMKATAYDHVAQAAEILGLSAAVVAVLPADKIRSKLEDKGWRRVNISGKTIYIDGLANSRQRKKMEDYAIEKNMELIMLDRRLHGDLQQRVLWSPEQREVGGGRYFERRSAVVALRHLLEEKRFAYGEVRRNRGAIYGKPYEVWATKFMHHGTPSFMRKVFGSFDLSKCLNFAEKNCAKYQVSV